MLWLADTLFGSRERRETPLNERQMDFYTAGAKGARAAVAYQIAVSAGRGVIGGVAGLATLADSYRRWQRKRAAIRELNALSDQMLKDIGLFRGEIRSVVTAMVDDRPAAGPTAQAETVARPADLKLVARSADRHTAARSWRRAA